MKEVRWTQTAKNTLQETSDFILELWNAKVQDQFLDQLEFRISQLQRNHELGSRFEETSYRKLIIHKTVALFYIDHPNYIKLLVIWDNRQDPDKILDKLIDANKR